MRQRSILMPVLVVVVVLAAGVLPVFHYGSPQWSRWIYVYQCYVLGRGQCPWKVATRERYLWPPAQFTGVWRLWHRDGTLNGVMQVKDGEQHGYVTFWDADGGSRGTAVWKDDKYLCESGETDWYRTGKRIESEADFAQALAIAERNGWNDPAAPAVEEEVEEGDTDAE